MRGLFRSALALLAGDAIFGGTALLLFRVANREPHAPAPMTFMLGSVAVGVVAAAMGGWVTAAIAGRYRRAHAAVLGILISFGALVSLIIRPGEGAIWTQAAAVVLMGPAALAGSWPWWSEGASSRRK